MKWNQVQSNSTNSEHSGLGLSNELKVFPHHQINVPRFLYETFGVKPPHNHSKTVGIQNSDVSGFRMVNLSAVFELSGFQMVLIKWLPFFSKPFENKTFLFRFGMVLTKWQPFCHFYHSKSDLQNVRFSNGYGFWMVGFWIPTVHILYLDPTVL